VPSTNGYFDGTKNKLPEFGCWWRKGVEATLTWTWSSTILVFLSLIKKTGVKLNKRVIVKSKLMNGNKIFVGGGDMKNILFKLRLRVGVGILELPTQVMSIPDPLAV
jgi:hypothetical protein